jgi:hypothetical protein
MTSRTTSRRAIFLGESPTMEGPLDSVDPLDTAILSRLTGVAGRWLDYDDETLTETERHADENLMACGFFRVEVSASVDNCETDECLKLSAIATGNLTREGVNQFVCHHCPWIRQGQFTHKVELRWWLSRICRTTKGEQAAAMVAAGASATVLHQVRRGPVLPPDIQLIERRITSKSAASCVAAAQAVARTGDVTQSIHQPITVNNQVDLGQIAEFAKVVLESRASPNHTTLSTRKPADLAIPTKDMVLATLRPCQRKAYEAYQIVLNALNENGVAAEDDAVWLYVKDVLITLSDGTEYQPPPAQATFMNYVNRVLRAFQRIQSDERQ